MTIAKPEHFFDVGLASPKVPGREYIMNSLRPRRLNSSLIIVESGTTWLLAKCLFRDLPRKDYTNEQMPRVCKEGGGGLNSFTSVPV